MKYVLKLLALLTCYLTLTPLGFSQGRATASQKVKKGKSSNLKEATHQNSSLSFIQSDPTIVTRLFNMKTKLLAPTESQTQWLPFQQDYKWGFCNRITGKKINCIYTQVKPFSFGLAAVNFEGRWGFIDTTGKEIIAPKFTSVEPFFGNAIIARYYTDVFIIDKNENSLVNKGISLTSEDIKLISRPTAVRGKSKCNPLYYVYRTGKSCIIFNSNLTQTFGLNEVFGKGLTYLGDFVETDDYIIATNFNNTSSVSDKALEDTQYLIIEKLSQRIGKYYTGRYSIDRTLPPDNFKTRERIYSSDFYGKQVYLLAKVGNSKGLCIIDKDFTFPKVYSNNDKLVLVNVSNDQPNFPQKGIWQSTQFGNTVLGYIYEDGTTMTDQSIKELGFNDGKIACVRKTDKWTYITRKGDKICDLEFDKDAPFINGVACNSINGAPIVIDANGKTVLKFEEGEIRSTSDSLLIYRVTLGNYDEAGRYFEGIYFNDGRPIVTNTNGASQMCSTFKRLRYQNKVFFYEIPPNQPIFRSLPDHSERNSSNEGTEFQNAQKLTMSARLYCYDILLDSTTSVEVEALEQHIAWVLTYNKCFKISENGKLIILGRHVFNDRLELVKKLPTEFDPQVVGPDSKLTDDGLLYIENGFRGNDYYYDIITNNGNTCCY